MLKNEVIIASSSALSQSVLHQSQAAPLRVKTQPGMKLELVIDGASVEIKAMDRTVLSYLIKPLSKTLSMSMGEK